MDSSFPSYRVYDSPELLASLADAPFELIDLMISYVFPILSQDPTDEKGPFGITYRDGYYRLPFRTEHLLGMVFYQVLDEERMVMVFRCAWVSDPDPLEP